MEYWYFVRPTSGIRREALAMWVATIEQAGEGLKVALTAGPEVRTIRLLLDPDSESLAPWLEAVIAATPEIRGLMVQGFFAQILSRAGYQVIVGSQLDVFARGRFRSILLEVKSSLRGGRFGSKPEMAQLDGYLIACQRRRADRWLGTMGIEKPMELRGPFRKKMRLENIGHLDLRWVSPKNTLPQFLSVPQGDSS